MEFKLDLEEFKLDLEEFILDLEKFILDFDGIFHLRQTGSALSPTLQWH